MFCKKYSIKYLACTIYIVHKLLINNIYVLKVYIKQNTYKLSIPFCCNFCVEKRRKKQKRR